jgi:hypothetical protein
MWMTTHCAYAMMRCWRVVRCWIEVVDSVCLDAGSDYLEAQYILSGNTTTSLRVCSSSDMYSM